MSKGRKKVLNVLVGEQDGIALMSSTLAIFVVLILLATTIVPLMVNERREASTIIAESRAWNIDKTGLERGVQEVRRTRVPPHYTDVPFDVGKYTVRYSAGLDESGVSLPRANYVTIRSTGKVGDVERNMRIILSTHPWAFEFVLYSQNLKGWVFNLQQSTVNGDMYYRGNVATTVPIAGTVYTPPGFSATTGSVTFHPDPQPPFPFFDQDPFLDLLYVASISNTGPVNPQNTTVFLSSYPDNTLYSDQSFSLQNSTVVGPGKIVAHGPVTIQESTVGDGVIIVAGQDMVIQNFSHLGTGVGNAGSDGIIIFSKKDIDILESTVYGLTAALGEVLLDKATYYGSVLSIGFPNDYGIRIISSTVHGSLVSKVGFELLGSTISRGNLPLLEGQEVGLEPYIIPGTWLEY